MSISVLYFRLLTERKNKMTNRERAMNLLHFKPADRLPAVHFGYWNELLAEWAEQGKISKELADNWGDGNEADAEIDKLIGWDFNWFRTVCGNIRLNPQFETKVLETFPDGTKRVQNGNGMIEKIKPGITSIPSEDDYLLKNRTAFEVIANNVQFVESKRDGGAATSNNGGSSFSNAGANEFVEIENSSDDDLPF